ncbi:MAG TPA: amidohydrolase family protein, partial [Acidimicrobiales bacterium]|nr:amidohydrolase family protein [Acidimicrobiales bacterium]
MRAHDDRTLISNARVISCAGGPTERPFEGDILIEGDRIVEVFRGSAPVDPATVNVIDVAGSSVLPGLCDAHAHISSPIDNYDGYGVVSMPDDEHALEIAGVVKTYLASGYTTIIGAGAFKPRIDVIIQSAIDRELIAGPRLWPAGEHLTTRGGIGPGRIEVEDPEAMRRKVGEQCELGVRFVKLLPSGDEDDLRPPSELGAFGEGSLPITAMDDAMVSAAVQEAQAHGAFVAMHARSTQSIRIAVRNGVRIVHHATYLDEASIDQLTAARDEIWVCPALHWLRTVAEGKAEAYGFSREITERPLRASIEGLPRLHRNGVRIINGGDFGQLPWTPHGTYAAEPLSYVELLGFSPLEALLTATANAGPLVSEHLGQLREGYLADLLFVDG